MEKNSSLPNSISQIMLRLSFAQEGLGFKSSSLKAIRFSLASFKSAGSFIFEIIS